MPKYLVEFFGELEIEAENEIFAEVDAINNHADAHVRVIELTEEDNDILY